MPGVSLRRGWRDLGLRGKGSVLVAIPLVVFAVATGLFAVTLRNDSAAQQSVRLSEQVQSQIAVINGLLVSRESDARGYVAFGNPEDLRRTQADDAQLANAVGVLRALVQRHTNQADRVDQLEAIVKRQPQLPAVLGSASTPALEAAAAEWMASARQVTSQATSVLAAMQDDAGTILEQRRRAADQWRALAGIGLGALLVIGILGGWLGVRMFARSVARRIDLLGAELEDIGAEPTTAPDESADEIGQLSRRLRATGQSLAKREAELSEARAFLENVLTVGPVVILRAVAGVVTYVSPNCERVLGVSAEEALSPEFWDRAVGTAEVAALQAAFDRLFEAGAPEVLEFEQVLRVRARHRHVSCVATREGPAATGRGIFVYLLDITERRNAEHEGAQRQRELRAITAASPDIIAVFSADLTVSFISEAVTSVTGFRVGDRIGKDIGVMVHHDDRSALVDALRAVLSGATEDFTIRVRSLHATGRYLQLEAHGRPLLGVHGEPVAAVAIFRDVSERVALEDALVEARDVADAASRAKSEFLSRMSHELRTPLNVVLGFTQLLQTEALGEEQHGWVEQVLKAGRHLLELINEVLDIARIESGALTLSPEAVSLRDVVGETVELMRPIATASDIRIDFLIEGDDLHVHADRQRLKQVLLNLLANGVKYNRTRGSVLVTCNRLDIRTIAIRVRDTGIGIAEADLGRLFVPFDRLGAEHSSVEGTGVGLAISLRLIQAMDGELTAESTPNEGSTFTITLPRALGFDGDPAPDDEQAIAAAELDMAFGEGAIETQGTVLYIEDNVTNLQLMQRIIGRRPGIRLLHAYEGRLGLDLARTGHADVILLDLHLPDMSGVEVLRQLRAEEATAEIPVYVVSADATAAQMARMRAAGAAGYLTKPIDVWQMLALLDSVFEGSVAATEGD